MMQPVPSGKKGHLFVVSAPSGTGKTTLCHLLLEAFEGISYSVSHTTRPPRAGEVHGKDYFFVTKEAFESMIRNNDLLEWAEVHGNYYGTSLGFIRDSLEQGLDILLDIDVQGAAQVVTLFPDAVTIFIMPPSMEALNRRLEKRGLDSRDVIQTRLRNAEEEIEKKDTYRHVLVNDNLETAKNELFDIIRSYR